jgi:hypothetical protein
VRLDPCDRASWVWPHALEVTAQNSAARFGSIRAHARTLGICVDVVLPTEQVERYAQTVSGRIEMRFYRIGWRSSQHGKYSRHQ